MTNQQYECLLGLMMCSDLWPESVYGEPIGYDNWIDAYHGMNTLMPYSGSTERKS